MAAGLAWRQPAARWIAGFVVLQSALIWAIAEDEDVLATAMALAAALGSLAALAACAWRLRQGARLSRSGVVGRFLLAGVVAGLVAPPLVGMGAGLLDGAADATGSARILGWMGLMVAPAAALFGAAVGALSGTAAAWVLFRRGAEG